MKKPGWIALLVLLVACVGLSLGFAGSAETAPVPISGIHPPDRHIEDADAALALLLEGNLRFVAGNLSDKSVYALEREALAEAQLPFAVILCCSDSRVAPEIFFDQEMGDLFTVRNAGNIADSTALGSIEYAAEHLHAPLVVVVGHSRCGAVTAAFSEGEHPANLRSILGRIQSACEGAADVDAAIRIHIAQTVAEIQGNEIVRECGAVVVGEIEFYLEQEDESVTLYAEWLTEEPRLYLYMSDGESSFG
ncbi:MAG TPA: carbonic anhydrase, partial [Clostridia bacterium]|nr:carbonic anhydrase [Clostridia bacterium]